MDAEGISRFALWLLPGVSSRRIDELRSAPGGARALLDLPAARLAEALGDRAPRNLEPARLLAEADRLWGRVACAGGRVLLRGEPGYPDLGGLADPPEALCVRGGELRARADSVAVVGARSCEASVRHEARTVAAALARAGRSVVSGGALGVDAAAHRGALEAGGHTVVVLGSGVLRPGPPSNRRLFATALESGAALVSELPPLEPPRALHFPRRNRLIAALAGAVVVAHAEEGSGSLHTAVAARKLGVPVLARRSGGAGCEALIAAGALPFDSPAEALGILGIREEVEDPVLAALAVRASVAALASRTGLTVGEAARELARLCEAGRARPCGPGEFVRA